MKTFILLCVVTLFLVACSSRPEYCGEQYVSSVEKCGDYYKVSSDLPGAGAEFHAISNNTFFPCPIVAPDQVSSQCAAMIDVSCGGDLC